MQRRWNRSYGLLLFGTCLLGCNGKAPAPTTEPPVSDSPTTAITREQLGNLSYPSELGTNGRIQLQNGVFEAQKVDDETAHLVVRLTDHMIEGDLNGDGRNDAAVVLESDSGGTGSFLDLAAVLSTPDGLQAVAVIDLGDRTEIRKMAFADGAVQIELIGHGPDDPVCCPTQVQQREYRLIGNQWVQSERQRPP
jgi:hypothetical protein